MIDGMSARALDEINARVRDLSGAYTPGFVPSLTEDRIRGAARTTAASDPLTVAPPEGTYLSGIDSRGRRFFSRDGRLQLGNGDLQFRDGAHVLGFASDGNGGTAVTPLRIDAVDAKLGRVDDARIAEDGTLSYARTIVDPRTGAQKKERVSVGVVALARFPAGTEPARGDGARVSAPHGVSPTIGHPGQDGFGQVQPEHVDQGEVDLHRGLAALRDAYLAFNAIQGAKSAHGKTDKIAMDLVK